jgi:hypothetical protein
MHPDGRAHPKARGPVLAEEVAVPGGEPSPWQRRGNTSPATYTKRALPVRAPSASVVYGLPSPDRRPRRDRVSRSDRVPR